MAWRCRFLTARTEPARPRRRAPDALVDFHTDRDSLALGALADCAGFRSVSGSLAGSQCRAHARPCARTLGIAGEDWVAGVLA